MSLISLSLAYCSGQRHPEREGERGKEGRMKEADSEGGGTTQRGGMIHPAYPTHGVSGHPPDTIWTAGILTRSRG